MSERIPWGPFNCYSLQKDFIKNDVTPNVREKIKITKNIKMINNATN